MERATRCVSLRLRSLDYGGVCQSRYPLVISQYSVCGLWANPCSPVTVLNKSLTRILCRPLSTSRSSTAWALGDSDSPDKVSPPRAEPPPQAQTRRGGFLAPPPKGRVVGGRHPPTGSPPSQRAGGAVNFATGSRPIAATVPRPGAQLLGLHLHQEKRSSWLQSESGDGKWRRLDPSLPPATHRAPPAREPWPTRQRALPRRRLAGERAPQ
jgi:hypothetical protein